ncbi:amino acid permease [haloarchaeon 3A1-DGR]|nr:amino acid permease [haloarchaeon 3A1-DGR]
MGTETLGLTEAVSIALGGMIGGGIYAVLGVVTQISGAATWSAFLLAGVVAACAGYSYVQLNALIAANDGNTGGGSVTFIRSFTGNTTIAGMVGWTLLLGYIGSMAMYAFAFAEFAISFPMVPESIGAAPLRPIVSVGAIAAFVGLNLLGARATGTVETVLVAGKVLVLVTFGLGGVGYAIATSPPAVDLGASTLTSFSPVMAAAVSFVAFQGWQLLFYDQESIENPLDRIPKAIAIAIATAVVVYVLVVVATSDLAPQALRTRPHTALVDAASTIAGTVGYAGAGATVISLSALLSTGSAINATLFSTGYFAKGMLSSDLLPDRVGDASADGVPPRTVLLIGGVTAAFTAVGSLSAITSFASLSFIVVFGAMSLLAFTQRDRERIRAVWPAVGAVGATLFFVLLFYHLYTAERETFYAVLGIAVATFLVETLYFERDVIRAEIPDLR